MKKIISIFIIIITLSTVFSTYNTIEDKYINNIYNIEQESCTEFNIENFNGIDEEIYKIIYDISKQMNLNIFRSFISYSKDDKPEIIKYILLNDKTDFFNKITISEGRIFNKDDFDNIDKFISTSKSDNPNQIGVLKIFGGRNDVKIKTLESSYKYHIPSGKYYVETRIEDEYNQFIKKLTEEINNKYKTNFSENDFKNKTETHQIYNNIEIPKYFNITLIFIISFLIIYDLINNSKKIGIMMLNGINKWTLWYRIFGKFVIINLLMMLILTFITTILIKNSNIEFLINIIIKLILYFSTVIVISFLILLYISKNSINNIIKNKKNTNLIISINLILKIIIAIFIMNSLFTTIEYYSYSSKKLDNLKNWEKSKDFGAFYPVKIGNDYDANKYYDVINTSLYPVLNDMGSILINARSYENDFLMNNNLEINSIKVNNNYLKEFPIYDLNNKSINISEEETEYIILVPEKYNNKKEIIEEFFYEKRKEFIEAEQNSNKKISEDIINQKVKIIWTRNNQKIFSFNQDVFINDNNMITDPIIEVITVNNSLSVDRDCILGSGNNDPLKIKLYNRDVKLTFDKLQNTLKELELEDNLLSLIKINDLAIQQVYELEQRTIKLLFISFSIFILYIILSIQNIILIFNKNVKEIILKRLFGISFIKIYRKLILVFSLSWIIQITAFIKLSGINKLTSLFIIILVLLTELVISLFAILKIEKSNRVKIIKDGF